MEGDSGAHPAPAVFVVDDSGAFRAALAELIATTDWRLAGNAAEAAGALAQLTGPRAVRVDLVVMDVQLPDGSGIELTRTLLAKRPDLRVLLVSTLDRDDLPDEAWTCGAVGFVPKSALDIATLRPHFGDTPIAFS